MMKLDCQGIRIDCRTADGGSFQHESDLSLRNQGFWKYFLKRVYNQRFLYTRKPFKRI